MWTVSQTHARLAHLVAFNDLLVKMGTSFFMEERWVAILSTKVKDQHQMRWEQAKDCMDWSEIEKERLKALIRFYISFK